LPRLSEDALFEFHQKLANALPSLSDRRSAVAETRFPVAEPRPIVAPAFMPGFPAPPSSGRAKIADLTRPTTAAESIRTPPSKFAFVRLSTPSPDGVLELDHVMLALDRIAERQYGKRAKRS
jgi:hypothetical protein